MARQRGGDGILVEGATLWTPAALDHVRGDDGRAHQDDIFDHAFTGGADATEGGAAIGTDARAPVKYSVKGW